MRTPREAGVADNLPCLAAIPVGRPRCPLGSDQTTHGEVRSAQSGLSLPRRGAVEGPGGDKVRIGSSFQEPLLNGIVYGRWEKCGFATNILDSKRSVRRAIQPGAMLGVGFF